jgi:hypothetical protein
VAEAPGQEALFRKDIPDDISESQPILDVRDFINGASLEPSACSSTAIKSLSPAINNIIDAQHSADADRLISDGVCCNMCASNLSAKLQQIADSINRGELDTKRSVQVDDLLNIANSKA